MQIANLKQGQLSLFRQYFLEIAVFGLACAVIYLFVLINQMQEKKESYLVHDRQQLFNILIETKQVIERNNEIFLQLKTNESNGTGYKRSNGGPGF